MKENNNLAILGKEELVEILEAADNLSPSFEKMVFFNPYFHSDEVAIAVANYCGRVCNSKNGKGVFLLKTLCPATTAGLVEVLNLVPDLYWGSPSFPVELMDEKLSNSFLLHSQSIKAFYQITKSVFTSEAELKKAFNRFTENPLCTDATLRYCYENEIGVIGICRNPNAPEELINKIFNDVFTKRMSLRGTKTYNRLVGYLDNVLEVLASNPKLSSDNYKFINCCIPKIKANLFVNPAFDEVLASRLIKSKSEIVQQKAALYPFSSKILADLYANNKDDFVFCCNILENSNVSEAIVNDIIERFGLYEDCYEGSFYNYFLDNFMMPDKKPSKEESRKVRKPAVLTAVLKCKIISEEQKFKLSYNFVNSVASSWTFMESYENDAFVPIYDILAKKCDIDDTLLFGNRYAYESDVFIERIMDYLVEKNFDFASMTGLDPVITAIRENIDIIPIGALEKLKRVPNYELRLYFESIISSKKSS